MDSNIIGNNRQMQSDTAKVELGTDFISSDPDLRLNIPDGQNLEGLLTDGPPVMKQKLCEDYNQLDEPILNTLLRDLNSIFQKIKIVSFPMSSYDIHKVVMRGWDLWGPLLLCTFLAFGLHHYDDKDNYSGLSFSDIFVMLWTYLYLISLNFRLLSISDVKQDKSVLPFELEIITEADQGLTKLSRQQQQDGGNVVISTTNNAPRALPMSSTSSAGDAENIAAGDSMSTTKMATSSHQRRQSLFCPPSLFQLMCVFGYSLMVPCVGLLVLKTFPFSRLLFERIIIGLLFGFLWPTLCSVRILFRYQSPSKRALAIYPIGLFYFILSSMMIMDH